MKYRTVSAHLSAGVADDLIAVAQTLGMSPSRTAALAIVWGLSLVKAGQGVNSTRIVGHIEYIHAALDLLMEREHPDIHAKLVDLAVDRLERHHG